MHFIDSHATECISLQPQPPPAPNWTADETTKGTNMMVKFNLLVNNNKSGKF